MKSPTTTVDPLLAALTRRRQQLGYHPDKISRALGWSGQAQIRQLETEGNPRLSTLRRWADALDVELTITPKGTP